MQFKNNIKIFIIAGELSGDQIGHSIIYELKKKITFIINKCFTVSVTFLINLFFFQFLSHRKL